MTTIEEIEQLYEIGEQLDVACREAPAWLLSDNGAVFWPPLCHFADFPEEWPFVAEAWEKYETIEEERRARSIRDKVECSWCRRQLQRWEIHRHVADVHRGTARIFVVDRLGNVTDDRVRFSFVNQLWTWEMLGFADLWWGKPIGWRTILDPRDGRSAVWEQDVIESGTRVADHLWMREEH